MEKITIIVRNYETKDGRTFTKLSVGGKFLPDVLAEDEVSYRVQFLKKSPAEEPKAEEPKETPEEKLEKLKKLYEQELISKEDYEAKKAEIVKDL